METEKLPEIDFSLVTNLEFDGIVHEDRPDYVDAYISAADYDGFPANEVILSQINDNSDFVHEQLLKYFNG